MVQDEYRDICETYLMRNFSRDLMITRGKGARVWDDKGNEYIDCVAGIAVCSTGHCHPKVSEAICRQAHELIHISNLFYIPGQAELAKRIVEKAGIKGGRVFFSNSGSEAVEAAVKLARVRTGKKRFIAFKSGFHGRTYGALSLTHKEDYRLPFTPLPYECEFVEYGDIEGLKAAMDETIAAVILEPVQGEAGVFPAPDGFLEDVRNVCNEHDALMIIDEVQTGFGRTGKWFGFQHADIEPDIITMAKGIASGFPMGAIVAREGLEFLPGEHGGTFNGGPLACAAAHATLDVLEEEIDDIERKGERFRDGLAAYNPRQRGLMIGVTLGDRCAPVKDYCEEHGVLVNCTSGNLRLIPPLVITDKEIDQAVRVINEALDS
ncbi:aspartate aminotransferase family protein [Methanogenium sp. MK-MG]|uniref:aspartate aminotransferase family protein n=1 Tax=Methanogenium sp. MK-MG TaxID=2599926 RepID=UPI0013EBB18C|nr:aspartate aminotransferase family protein [Methanogenium sp. MK-MG]KAF1078483.1 (LysW)-aminoadipate semialdehyde/glutamate semialdehyde transaminase [Methanogenium sp. MK-MG]